MYYLLNCEINVEKTKDSLLDPLMQIGQALIKLIDFNGRL
jgi:hypothetical protein